jgi:hypothetical protein
VWCFFRVVEAFESFIFVELGVVWALVLEMLSEEDLQISTTNPLEDL